MSSKLFKSIKNGTIAKLVAENGDSVMLHILDTDEEKVIASATLKRWWKPCEDGWEEVEDFEETDKVNDAPVKPAKTEAAVPQEKKEVKKEARPSKSKEEAINDYSGISQHIFDFIEKMQEEHNITLFSSEKVKGFYSLKKDDKIYMALTFSKKSGVTLWLRSKAIEGIAEYKHYNHAFDARIILSSWNLEIYDLLTKLHNASLEFQLEKNSKSKK